MTRERPALAKDNQDDTPKKKRPPFFAWGAALIIGASIAMLIKKHDHKPATSQPATRPTTQPAQS